jgi:hypothetical protein
MIEIKPKVQTEVSNAPIMTAPSVTVAAPAGPVEPNTAALVRANTAKVAADSMPSNWDLTATADGVFAKNNVTGREFTGTMVAFNEALRSY